MGNSGFKIISESHKEITRAKSLFEERICRISVLIIFSTFSDAAMNATLMMHCEKENILELSFSLLS